MADQSSDISILRSIMPPGVIHRNLAMEALARRAVLAYLDADPDTLAAVLERVGTWDDVPRERPYPASLPRYRFAAQRALGVANEAYAVAEHANIQLQDSLVRLGARKLVADLAPEQHRREALEILHGGGRDSAGTEVRSDALDGPAGLVAYAATAAHLFGNPRLFASQHLVRKMLLSQIREADAEAQQAPDLERITDVSDREAGAFLDRLWPGFRIPGSDEISLPELEIVSMIKRHLLTTPADATTPEQERELTRCIEVILTTGLAASEAKNTTYRVPAESFPNSPRTQPRRKKPKSKR